MPVLRDWDLHLDVDRVLRGQGADPGAIRARSQALVELAERALEEGEELLAPAVLYQSFSVGSLSHERLELEGGARLHGPLIAQHLAGAQEIVLMLCTIGAALETRASELMAEDLAYGLALDGLGSAAAEALANESCHFFEQQWLASGMEVSIPLSPGMVGWPVDTGQKEIFALLETELVGVSLTDSSVMIPRKSITLALGMGPTLRSGGTTCDFCSMRTTCRYQDHYAQARSGTQSVED
jgi:hypothetical protein